MASPRKQIRRRPNPHKDLALIQIEIEKGPGKGRRMEIPEGETSLGRSDDCDFQIDNEAASRLHATLFREGDTIVIRDEGSHNGTYVNESEIDGDIRLEAGDRIQIGDAVLCLVIDGVRERFVDDTEEEGISTLQKIGVFLLVLVICTSVFIILLPKLGILDVTVPATHLHPVPTSPGAITSPTTIVTPPVQVAVPPISTDQNEGNRHKPQVAFRTAKETNTQRVSPTPTSTGLQLPQINTVPPPVSAASVYRKSESKNSTIRESSNKKIGTGNKAKDERRAKGMYVKGDLTGARQLAEEIGATKLAKQIRDFQEAEGQAKAAVSFKKGTEAIESYENAFEIDDEIVSSYSKNTVSVPGRRVRKALSQLYQQAGESFFKRHNNEKAADFFEQSLEYDRTNARSREFLKKLGRTEDDIFSDDEEF